MKAIGILLFFTGTFTLALAYTMALQGVYVDCFAWGGESGACTLRLYREPTVMSASYGTFLAAVAIGTWHIGLETLRWLRETATLRKLS